MDKGTLTVTVESGRNLGGSHTNGFFLDSYCCLFLYDSSGVLKNTKHKTKLAKRTSHPEWNESFDFFVNPKIYGIYVVVKRKGTFKSSSFLGSVSIPATELVNVNTTPVVHSFQLFGKKASTTKKEEADCGEVVLRFVFAKSKDKLEDISAEISKDRDRSKRLSIQSLSSVSSTEDPKRALKLEAKSKKLQKMFNTPTDLRVIDAFSCAYQSHMPHQGTLYLTEDYLFFKSLTKKLMIKLANIQAAEKKMIPGSIRIAVPNKEYIFMSLYNREKAIALITETRENSIKNMNSEGEISFRDDLSEASIEPDLQSVDTDTDTDMDTNSSYNILSPMALSPVQPEDTKPPPVVSPTVTPQKEAPVSPAVDLESLDTLVHSPAKENTDDELHLLQKQHTRVPLSASLSLPAMSLQQPRRRLSMNLPHSVSVPSSPSPEKHKAKDDLSREALPQLKVEQDIILPDKDSKSGIKAFLRSNFTHSTKTKQKFRKSVTFSPAEKEIIAQTINNSSNNNITEIKPEQITTQPEEAKPEITSELKPEPTPLQKDVSRKQDMKALLSLAPDIKKPRQVQKKQAMTRWENSLLQMQYFAAITFATGWILSDNSTLVTMLHALITAVLLSALQPAKTADAVGQWLKQMVPPLNAICNQLQAASTDQQVAWKRLTCQGALYGSNYLFGVGLTTIILLCGLELTPHLHTSFLLELERALVIAFFALYVETVFD